MTAKPIRQLLTAKPFKKFTLHFGFESETTINDPKRCRLDEDELLLYVSFPEVQPPEFVRHVLVHASVEIIDLRHVATITVEAEKMPE